jgi:3-methylfumaryl-CoA hydratase
MFIDKEQPIKAIETCSMSMVKRVAAMLDLSMPALTNGNALPQGWHFFLLAGDTKKSALRQDGFPGLGVPLPDLGLPRLLLGGRTVSYEQDIIIGEEVKRTSFIKSITEKNSSTGPMAIVAIQHELRAIDKTTPALTETQTYLLLSNNNIQLKTQKEAPAPVLSKWSKQVIPDETLLFQYSALGFNSHKIHLDKNYAMNVEGFPDLVVNGGLATLLLTEFLRTELKTVAKDIKVKHIAPLFCNNAMTITAESEGTNGTLKIFDNNNTLAVEADVTLKTN